MPTNLSPACSGLFFSGKFSDIAALNAGDKNLLRPTLNPMVKKATFLPNSEKKVALIIGGNGFVGVHLAARLSLEPNIRQIIVMVRASQQQTCDERFEDAVNQYKVPAFDRDKITFVNASATQKNWGLALAGYQALTEKVQLVFSCASSTDYDSPYLAMRDDWVMGLLQIIQFCLDGCTKHLSYMGSIGARLYSECPDNFRRGDSWWYSGYAQMKWVNEEILKWVAHDRFLSVTLCESPYIFGHSKIGVDPGLHYSWWRLMEIAQNIKQIWRGEGMTYCPVDILTDALTVNVMLQEPLDFIRPCNTEPYDNALLAKILGCDLVDWDEFSKTARGEIFSRRLDSLLQDDMAQAVALANGPAVFPAQCAPDWCDNEKLLRFYFDQVNFRNIRIDHKAGARAG